MKRQVVCCKRERRENYQFFQQLFITLLSLCCIFSIAHRNAFQLLLQVSFLTGTIYSLVHRYKCNWKFERAEQIIISVFNCCSACEWKSHCSCGLECEMDYERLWFLIYFLTKKDTNSHRNSEMHNAHICRTSCGLNFKWMCDFSNILQLVVANQCGRCIWCLLILWYNATI